MAVCESIVDGRWQRFSKYLFHLYLEYTCQNIFHADLHLAVSASEQDLLLFSLPCPVAQCTLICGLRKAFLVFPSFAVRPRKVAARKKGGKKISRRRKQNAMWHRGALCGYSEVLRKTLSLCDGTALNGMIKCPCAFIYARERTASSGIILRKVR